MRRFAARLAGINDADAQIQPLDQVDPDGNDLTTYIRYLDSKLRQYKLMQQALVDLVKLGIDEQKFKALGEPDELRGYVIQQGAEQLPLSQILVIARSQIKGACVEELDVGTEEQIRRQKLLEIENEVRQRNDERRQMIMERRRQQEEKQMVIEKQLQAEDVIAGENKRRQQQIRKEKAKRQLDKVEYVRARQQQLVQKQTQRAVIEPDLEFQRRQNIVLRNREIQLKRKLQKDEERRLKAQALHEDYERQYRKNKSAMHLQEQLQDAETEYVTE